MTRRSVQVRSMGSRPDKTLPQGRDVAIDYLRAFLIVLVVCLHAAIAYASFSTFNRARWVDSTAPVVDSSRWPVLDLLVFSLDTFLMPLMFLISGVFTLSGLERQGAVGFFRARLKRLGIPFAVGALVLAPLHFLPSYLMADHETYPPYLSMFETHRPYLSTFFTSDGWPVGAPWFLWVLLAFDGLAALVYWFAPNVLARLCRPPTAFLILLATIVSFLPLALVGSHFGWVSVGPFDVQPIRLGLFLAYFLLGMALSTGQEWKKAGWPKRWGVWLVLVAPSFFVYLLMIDNPIRLALPSLVGSAIVALSFAVSCAGMSLGCLGAFRSLMCRKHRVLDSLSANSYGIYLVHYVIVTWLQFALLPVSWPAWIKFGVVLPASVALSWGTSILLRRIPAVRQII